MVIGLWRPEPGVAPEVNPLGRHRTLSAVALSSTLQHQCIVEWSDMYGIGIILGTNSSGNAVAKWTNPWDTSKNVTVTSANVDADGRTHTFAATLSNDGAGTSTLRLYVDGIERGTAATFTTAASGYILPPLRRISVGGTAFGDMFTGTISHVAGYGSALTTLADHHAAASTGFAGDRSDERIERIASWLGLPADLLDLDVGPSRWPHGSRVRVPRSAAAHPDRQTELRARSDTAGTGAYLRPGTRRAAGTACSADRRTYRWASSWREEHSSRLRAFPPAWKG